MSAARASGWRWPAALAVVALAACTSDPAGGDKAAAGIEVDEQAVRGLWSNLDGGKRRVFVFAGPDTMRPQLFGAALTYRIYVYQDGQPPAMVQAGAWWADGDAIAMQPLIGEGGLSRT